MKASKIYLKTYKDAPANIDSTNHALLSKAGMIYQNSSGIFSFLPLGYRVLSKIRKIVEEEMDNIGAQQISMPTLSSSELWKKSGRWNVYGKELMRIKDRHDREYALTATAEEEITNIVGKDVVSYKDLPIHVYQITTKFRDEVRPRFGLLRSREFLMKDGYGFNKDDKSLDILFDEISKAYSKIFTKMELNFKACDADTGAIGGSASLEFIVMTDAGEADVAFCNSCGYAANTEKASNVLDETEKEDIKELTKVETPNQSSIEDVANFLQTTANKCLKSLVVTTEKEFFSVVLRGDCDLNEHKLASLLKTNVLRLATDEEIKSLKLEKGYIGPINSKIKIIADEESIKGINLTSGANKKDYHQINLNYGRDWKADIIGDIRLVKKGDKCHKCSNPLDIIKGIEVGHIFKIGPKYSEALDVKYIDENGKRKAMIGSSYGIGVTRLMGAIVEQKNDDKGIAWPKHLAPFLINVIIANTKNESQITFAEKLYEDLNEKGIETFLDDRKVSAGFKFKDSDLIGIPYKVIVGSMLKEGKVEIKPRSGDSIICNKEEILDNIVNL